MFFFLTFRCHRVNKECLAEVEVMGEDTLKVSLGAMNWINELDQGIGSVPLYSALYPALYSALPLLTLLSI